jgi:hypothetical protein
MNFDLFLENSVYYPACRFDGTPIKFLGKLFSNYVYVDYNSEYGDLESNINNGLLGYKLKNGSMINAEELFGVNWESFSDENNDIYRNLPFEWKNPFAKIYSFERSIGFNDVHGKKNIELLYIKAEGISTYKYLYCKKNITPKCLASIVPGLAFGGNFSDYPKLFIKIIKLSNKFPQYQFYDDQCAEDFYELIKNYNEINHYNHYRTDYTWSSYFTLAELK